MLILCFKGSFQSLGLTTNAQVYTELFLPLRISRPDFRKLVREEVDWKKNVFFRAVPELPKPPPPDPNLGNLVLFFRKSKFKIWKSV